MTIALRPACSDDYTFALNLYVEAIKPLASTWAEWVDGNQQAQFARLWRPDDTWIITHDGKEVGWVELRPTGDEIYLMQLYISSAHQGRGIGSQIMHRLMEERRGRAKSVALLVLKNNPALRFYERHGFSLAQETRTKFVTRRKMVEAA
jgi:ribosomal protein S18 acetylase RimI-like enzyme